MMDSWFDELPLDDLLKINTESGENVPQESPSGETIQGGRIRCGPILRLAGTHENGPNYRATMLIILDQVEKLPEVKFHIGPASEGLAENDLISEGSFQGTEFYSELDYHFYRYAIDLELADYEQRVRYTINGHSGPTYLFFIPSKLESMNVVSHSCNGFSLATETASFKSSLWYDVLKSHNKNHYHVMLGGGDQIYADAIKLETEAIKTWTEANALNKLSLKVGDKERKQIGTFYLEHYIKWFGSGFWAGKAGKTLASAFSLAMATIPSINIYDDHDIIDGFGSYRDQTMKGPFFLAIGNLAFKYYSLFQHHMSPEEALFQKDPSWILPDKPGPYIKQKSHSTFHRLGKEIACLGVDCRTERTRHQVIYPETYKTIFDRVRSELKKAPEVKHLLVMLGVPIFYPRLVWLEWLMTSTIMVPFRKLAVKGFINKGLVNEFDGNIELLDDLDDHWCAKHHKAERNKLVDLLINLGSNCGVRVTILSGDVHLCAIGRVQSRFSHHPHAHILSRDPKELEQRNLDSKEHPQEDPRLIFNVISSAITNGPPPDAMTTLLEKRSGIHHFNRDTDEDIVPIFRKNTNGTPRSNHRFLNKRNWSDLIIAKQSIYKEKVNEGISRYPGIPLSDDSEDFEHSLDSGHYVKYPLIGDSLVTTLHVEDDPSDYECKTARYELFIPQLSSKYELDKTKIKHVN